MIRMLLRRLATKASWACLDLASSLDRPNSYTPLVRAIDWMGGRFADLARALRDRPIKVSDKSS